MTALGYCRLLEEVQIQRRLLENKTIQSMNFASVQH